MRITFTMTTCNRLDITLKTLESLKKYKYLEQPFKVIIMIDCFNSTFYDTLRMSYPDSIFVFPRSTEKKRINLRHMHNLQQLFEMVDTRWWFHCEDDWEFVAPGFIENSLDVLSDPHKNDSIYMIIGRKPNSFKPHVDEKFGWHKSTTGDNVYSVLKINSGPAGKFSSYTANPALIDVYATRRMIGNFSNYKGEYDVSSKLGKRHGARVGIFKEHYYYHLGDGVTTMKRLH